MLKFNLGSKLWEVRGLADGGGSSWTSAGTSAEQRRREMRLDSTGGLEGVRRFHRGLRRSASVTGMMSASRHRSGFGCPIEKPYRGEGRRRNGILELVPPSLCRSASYFRRVARVPAGKVTRRGARWRKRVFLRGVVCGCGRRWTPRSRRLGASVGEKSTRSLWSCDPAVQISQVDRRCSCRSVGSRRNSVKKQTSPPAFEYPVQSVVHGDAARGEVSDNTAAILAWCVESVRIQKRAAVPPCSSNR